VEEEEEEEEEEENLRERMQIWRRPDTGVKID